MPLNDLQARRLKPKDKIYKKSVGKGLLLQVNPNGSKYWRFSYRFAGLQKTLALGVYPEIPLKEAKEKTDEARRLLREGIDPSAKRKIDKLKTTLNQNNSFECIAREWHEKYSPSWSESHRKKLMARLENDVFPWLGARPIAEIEAPELLATLRRIENRGALDSAHRTLQTCGQIFRYGVASGTNNRDICSDLKGAIPPARKQHFKAITKPAELAPMLRDMRNYKGSLITQVALKILPYVFVRSCELRNAEWAEIDLDNQIWRIPSDKMKMKIEHVVPLSNQVIEALRELHPLTSGRSNYVFHGGRSTKKAMSENAILAAIRSLGYPKEQVTPHGFRATARTLLDEVLDFPPHLIEHQLAHAVKDANGRAYNRTRHLPQRIEMMQAWADYLDNLVDEI